MCFSKHTARYSMVRWYTVSPPDMCFTVCGTTTLLTLSLLIMIKHISHALMPPVRSIIDEIIPVKYLLIYEIEM